MRFVALNLNAIGVEAEEVYVITEAGVNEALFDIFFTLMDLSVIQIPFVNFFIHHQSYTNSKVLPNAPTEAFDALYSVTGCDSFNCLKTASITQLLSVDQSQFVLTSQWERQIDRLFQFRAKYKFTFLLDEKSFDYSWSPFGFDELVKDSLLQNRDHPDKIAILLDYFYRQKLPAAKEDASTITQRAYYDFKVKSVVASTLNVTSTSRMIEKDTTNEDDTTFEDLVQLILSSSDFPTYTSREKNCIRWKADFNLQDSGNCSVEAIEFWNRVLPNVDAPYECHLPDEVEVRPSFQTSDDITVSGRKITEFGRPGLNTYFGIPYATPPVGPNRFQRPVTPATTGTIDAGLYRPECTRTLQDADMTSEDCLYLDIWQPTDASAVNPHWTVVYFCDGYVALDGVAASEVEGSRCRNWMGYFTEDHDVISIHISYRQGILGFGTDLETVPANNGFADQEMALDWLYANLEQLGGRPDMMVFVGQGFGGICALLHAKKYNPTRIVSSSASLNMKFPFTSSPKTTADKLVKKQRCTSSLLDCLSNMSTEEVVAASKNLGHWPYGLVIDGELVNDIEMDDLFGIDMLLGLNTGDAFGWANDQYNRLNAHPFGKHYDQTEVLTDVIQNDFMKQSDRSTEADLALLSHYLKDADDEAGDRNQIPLRETVTNFYGDEGFWHPIYRAASKRDFSQQKTFVYKFAVNSWYTDIERPAMINSPKPMFAGAIRNDEADFVFKYFTSSPSEYYRYYNDEVMWTQDNMSLMWAEFIKTGSMVNDEAGFVADEFKNGHCVISIDYYEYFYMVCALFIP